MTTRNPFNERYTEDDHSGKTRKSAASAKPKSRAGSTVYVQSSKKTEKEKRAERKEMQRETRANERRYYNPDTPEYKKWRKIWWITIGCAIALAAAAFFVNAYSSEPLMVYIPLGISYVFIVAAIIIDVTRMKRERKRYAFAMQDKSSPEYKRAQEREAAEAAAKKAKEKAKAEKTKASKSAKEETAEAAE